MHQIEGEADIAKPDKRAWRFSILTMVMAQAHKESAQHHEHGRQTPSERPEEPKNIDGSFRDQQSKEACQKAQDACRTEKAGKPSCLMPSVEAP